MNEEQMQRALTAQFELEERGEVEIKGQGRLRTWLLGGQKLSHLDKAQRAG